MDAPLDPATPLVTGILLFDEVEELDAVGPWEVFGAATLQFPQDRVLAIGPRAGTLRAAKGLRLVADLALEDAPPLDVLLVPGGRGARALAGDARVLDWLRATAGRARWTASVCTGALLLQAAGLLDGRRATTHWSFCDELEARGVAVLRGRRWVRDGRVVTAAGVSAGIDMALWLLGQLRGEEAARQAQRYIEYEPAPPYAAAT